MQLKVEQRASQNEKAYQDIQQSSKTLFPRARGFLQEEVVHRFRVAEEQSVSAITVLYQKKGNSSATHSCWICPASGSTKKVA